MKIIGITGRSGCGKSSVSQILRQKGYTVLDADRIAREVVEPPSACLGALADAFGTDILDENGRLRRRFLADRAFATPEGTAKLTAITNRAILDRIAAGIDTARQAGERLVFVDGAVIVGTPFQAQCDGLIVVSAPEDLSVARITARDGISPGMARRRLDAQTPQAELDRAADWIVVNDADLEALRARTLAVLEALES